jgi:hypothetical protein
MPPNTEATADGHVIPNYNNYRPHGSIDLRCPEEYLFRSFNLTDDVNA